LIRRRRVAVFAARAGDEQDRCRQRDGYQSNSVFIMV
jgi:hypothetical protein